MQQKVSVPQAGAPSYSTCTRRHLLQKSATARSLRVYELVTLRDAVELQRSVRHSRKYTVTA